MKGLMDLPGVFDGVRDVFVSLNKQLEHKDDGSMVKGNPKPPGFLTPVTIVGST